jgi:hypothetical protein
MTVNVAEAIKELIADILGNRQTAIQFAGDPHGEMAARGITEGDLSNVDVNGLAREACGGAGIPQNVQTAVQSATGGGSASHPPAHSVDQVVQQLQQVTYVAYEGDTNVTNHIINNDNSTDIDVDGDFNGDIDIDNTNTSASEGGVANSGEGDVNAATGDRANAVGGDNHGNVNSGDGAVQADGDINAPVNTGTNSGVIADGDVNDTVVGDHNNTANVDGNGGEAVFNFGGGDVNQANHNAVQDGAVSAGGDATNVSHNDASQGGAISGTGDASGHFSDDHSTNVTTDVQVDADVHDFNNTDSYNHEHEAPLHVEPLHEVTHDAPLHDHVLDN